jgi:hypothetical protein
MAIAQVPAASITMFCVAAVIAVLVIRNLNYLVIMISNLWSMLPPNDVIAMYVATGALSIFALYAINHVVVQRKPINLDTVIKENKYFEINYYTAASFCIAVITTIIYFTYFYDDDDGGSGSGSGSILGAVAAAVAASKRDIGTFSLVMFGVAIITMIQLYHVMLWSITDTPIIKA